MEPSLADILNALPRTELLRIQKGLKVILYPGAGRERVKAALRDGYRRLGAPSARLRSDAARAAFQKLIENFGVVGTESLNPQERTELLKNPFTVWPDESRTRCFLPGEALDGIIQDGELRQDGFLLHALFRLTVRERRAWRRWLQSPELAGSEKELSICLYRRLGELRRRDRLSENRIGSPDGDAEEPENPGAPGDLPEYLDEIFPDDPLQSPLAWFYRDILPLYQCLAEAEAALSSARSNKAVRRQAQILALFKTGRIVVRPNTPHFGEPVRYSIHATREALPRTKLEPVTPATAETRQEVLF